ncbi:hypothetical protein NSB04_02960 [Blautia pseudococcoides]|nr:hypothetical protein [Blautia pseudococcoides]
MESNGRKEDNEAWRKVQLARKMTRVRTLDIIENVFDLFVELHGDRGVGDDKSIIGGIGLLEQQAVTIIGHQKGKNHVEMNYRQHGMTKPEGYRKSLRLMQQAEKFGRPIISFIDTPGAFPGVVAEKKWTSRSNCKKPLCDGQFYRTNYHNNNRRGW